MSMDPLLTGPRWWRVLLHGAFAVLLLTSGLAIVVLGGGVGLFGSSIDIGYEGARGRFIAFTVVVSLGAACLRLGFSFGRDAIALHRRQESAAPGAARVSAAAFSVGCAYCAVSGIILDTNTANVPLWGMATIILLPPIALFIARIPKMKQARRERLAALAAARPVGPVVTTRNQRVVRNKSRSQRRR